MTRDLANIIKKALLKSKTYKKARLEYFVKSIFNQFVSFSKILQANESKFTFDHIYLLTQKSPFSHKKKCQ